MIVPQSLAHLMMTDPAYRETPLWQLTETPEDPR